MRRIGIAVAIVLLVAGGAVFTEPGKNLVRSAYERIMGAEEVSLDFFIDEFSRRISTPDPLFGPLDGNDAQLTVAGVAEWTNAHRAQAGLASLRTNAALNASAQVKALDMLERQYFAHEAPTGEGVADLVQESGYAFVAIGENLALGNFEDDQTLVQAWMDSPGHRANILKDSYREIGVAVVRGEYEGRTTWVAVQHFGLPSSACPPPSQTTKLRIEQNQTRLNELILEIDAAREDVRSTWPKRGPAYEEKAERYDALVNQYNELYAETVDLVTAYNIQVREFNRCLEG